MLLVDDNAQPGGQIWRASLQGLVYPGGSDAEAVGWLRRLSACGATRLLATRIVACLAHDVVLAETLSDAVSITFTSVILATGARELLLPFPGWTLPNVMAAGGLQALVKSGLPVCGKRIVVLGTGPLLLAVAAFLQANAAEVVGVFEQSPWTRILRFTASLFARPAVLASAAAYAFALGGPRYHCGWWPVGAQGTEQLESITVTNGKRTRNIPCDFVAAGFHLVPNTELASSFKCRIESGHAVVDEEQRTSIANVFSVGESTGIGGLDLALIEGQIAGIASVGRPKEPSLSSRKRSLSITADAMNEAFALRPELKHLAAPDTIICRCEDVPWSALETQASLRSAKLYTRCGMGPCQGRVCGPILTFLLGWTAEPSRPPIYPVRLATLIAEPQAQYKENS